jgi:hypothetical protein
LGPGREAENVVGATTRATRLLQGAACDARAATGVERGMRGRGTRVRQRSRRVRCWALGAALVVTGWLQPRANGSLVGELHL